MQEVKWGVKIVRPSVYVQYEIPPVVLLIIGGGNIQVWAFSPPAEAFDDIYLFSSIKLGMLEFEITNNKLFWVSPPFSFWGEGGRAHKISCLAMNIISSSYITPILFFPLQSESLFLLFLFPQSPINAQGFYSKSNVCVLHVSCV